MARTRTILIVVATLVGALALASVGNGLAGEPRRSGQEWGPFSEMMGGTGGMMGSGMMGGTGDGMMGSGMMGGTGGGMMGNGMMGGQAGRMMGGMVRGQYAETQTTEPTLTAEQAQKTAQIWLDQYQPGATAGTADQFYGYYTLPILKDGKVTGMLSVNGYSGNVRYQTCHGGSSSSAWRDSASVSGASW